MKKIFEIDEAKLMEVQEIIEKATELMEENDYETDLAVKEELSGLQKRMRILTGKEQFDIRDVYGYWSYTDLETIATKLLLKEPQRCGLSDEELRTLIASILASGDLKKEARLDYWRDFLELETGIDVMNYFWDFNEKGELTDAPIDRIIEQIRENRLIR